MKLKFHFRDKLIGTGSAEGEEPVRWEGEVGTLKDIAAYYASERATGEKLLKLMADRLGGQWWTAEAP